MCSPGSPRQRRARAVVHTACVCDMPEVRRSGKALGQAGGRPAHMSGWAAGWAAAQAYAARGGNADGAAARRYFARLGRGAISVYETPDMGLLDKRSLKLEGVQDFAWSPAAPLLCAYQAEGAGGNLPARVSLIRIPDRA